MSNESCNQLYLNKIESKEVFVSKARGMQFKFTEYQNDLFGSLRSIQYIGEDEIWFVAKDLSDRLEYSDAYEATKLVPDTYKIIEHIASRNPNNTRLYPTIMVSTIGMHYLLGGSSKPNAAQFKEWVYAEVLPSIRKHGYYTDTKNMYARTVSAAINDGLGVSIDKIKPSLYVTSDADRLELEKNIAVSQAIRMNSINVRNDLTKCLKNIFTPIQFANMTNHLYFNLFGHTAQELKDMIHFKDNNVQYSDDMLLRNHFRIEALNLIVSCESMFVSYFIFNHGLTEDFVQKISDPCRIFFNPYYLSNYPIKILPFRVETIKTTMDLDEQSGLSPFTLSDKYFNVI